MRGEEKVKLESKSPLAMGLKKERLLTSEFIGERFGCHFVTFILTTGM